MSDEHHDDDRDDWISTRPRALIRYLGGTVGLTAGAPSVMGVAYFASHPSEAMADPGSAAFNAVLASVVSWAFYRWMRIGGDADRQWATFRGFVRTVSVPTREIATIERRFRESYSFTSGGKRMIGYFALIGDEGRELAEIPSSLDFCEAAGEFRNGVLRLARAGRVSGSS